MLAPAPEPRNAAPPPRLRAATLLGLVSNPPPRASQPDALRHYDAALMPSSWTFSAR